MGAPVAPEHDREGPGSGAQRAGSRGSREVRDEETAGSILSPRLTSSQVTALRRPPWPEPSAARDGHELSMGSVADHQLPERFSLLKLLTGDPGSPQSDPIGGRVLFAPNGGPQMPSEPRREVQARPARLVRHGIAQVAGRRAAPAAATSLNGVRPTGLIPGGAVLEVGTGPSQGRRAPWNAGTVRPARRRHTHPRPRGTATLVMTPQPARPGSKMVARSWQ